MTDDSDRDTDLEARLLKLRPSLPTASLDIRIAAQLRRRKSFHRYTVAAAAMLLGAVIGFQLLRWRPEAAGPVPPIAKPIDPPPIARNIVRPGQTRTMRELFWGEDLSFDRPNVLDGTIQPPPPLRAGDWRRTESIALLQSEATP